MLLVFAAFPASAQALFGSDAALRKILLLLGFGPFVLLLAGLAAWRLWPAPAPQEARTFNLGNERLRFAASYLRNGETLDPERIDLVVLAPDFSPAAADPQRLPSAGEAGEKGRAEIFIALTPAPKLEGRAAAAAPAERYGPYLAAEAQVAEGALLRRRFEDKSPYAGEDLYLAPPDGEEFYARCQRQRIPDDGLPNTCLAEFRIESILAQIRFDPAWLGQWAVLRANAFLLVRGALQP
jgi:hypothetical protein